MNYDRFMRCKKEGKPFSETVATRKPGRPRKYHNTHHITDYVKPIDMLPEPEVLKTEQKEEPIQEPVKEPEPVTPLENSEIISLLRWYYLREREYTAM